VLIAAQTLREPPPARKLPPTTTKSSRAGSSSSPTTAHHCQPSLLSRLNANFSALCGRGIEIKIHFDSLRRILLWPSSS
jgi:hypothetical protein